MPWLLEVDVRERRCGSRKLEAVNGFVVNQRGAERCTEPERCQTSGNSVRSRFEARGFNSWSTVETRRSIEGAQHRGGVEGEGWHTPCISAGLQNKADRILDADCKPSSHRGRGAGMPVSDGRGREGVRA